MTKKYQLAALGGTFDHFHLGHEQLLETAIGTAKTLIIGLTQKSLQGDKAFASQIESYSKRLASVQSFLMSRKYSQNTAIVSLNDPYGPTLTNTKIEALVVSRQTQKGAKNLNLARLKAHLPPLPIVITDMVRDDHGEHISSTRIREGVINRRGQTYFDLFQLDITLPPARKQKISAPQGQIITLKELSPVLLSHFNRVALVGDQTTEFFLKHNLPFHYALIDHMINRKKHATNLSGFHPRVIFHAPNPPGSIRAVASLAIRNLIQHSSGLMEVDGEEDLLGFPLLAVLPLGSVLFYGQPGLGIVQLQVTEKSKSKLINLVSGVDI